MFIEGKGFGEILLHMNICIGEDELIVGSYAGKPEGVRYFPSMI